MAREFERNSEVLEKSSRSFSNKEKGKLCCMQSGKTKLGKELSIAEVLALKRQSCNNGSFC